MPPSIDSAVGVSRFATYLRRLLMLKGPSIQSVNTQFQMTVSEVDRLENWGLAGCRPWALGFTVTAVAAVPNWCAVVNPAGSGVIAVVQGCQFSAGAADDVFLTMHQGDMTAMANYTNLGTMNPRDGRFFTPVGGGSMACRLDKAQQVAGPAGAQVTLARKNTTLANWYYPDMPAPQGFAVLPPGFEFIMRGTAVNVTQTFNFVGYERSVEQSELNIR